VELAATSQQENDLTSNPFSAAKIADTLCGTEGGCLTALATEVKSATLEYEAQAEASIGMMRSVLRALAAVSGRKTLVLASAGMVSGDRPGARPDLHEVGIQVGKDAARANVAVYTLFFDTIGIDEFSADRQKRRMTVVERDSQILGRWLEQFAGESGGSFAKVMTGSGESALDRVASEISAYYLLGVEPAETDRDGRPHAIDVKVKDRSVTVRKRSWVVVPPRATATPPAAERRDAAVVNTPTPARPLPPSLATLANLSDARDENGIQAALRTTADVQQALRDFRDAGGVWPASPKRDTILALEIARAALRARAPDLRLDGGRLLAQYGMVVQQFGESDPFECAWHRAEVEALEGLNQPVFARAFVDRALDRCPADGAIVLARAVVAEQEWRLHQTAPAAASSPLEHDAGLVLELYDAAMRFPAVAAEARLRAAWLTCELGHADRAQALFDRPIAASQDPLVAYFEAVVRGRVWRDLRQADRAAASYRQALSLQADGQAARIGLMTLAVVTGDNAAAQAQAEAVQSAPADAFDPWWVYPLGGYHDYVEAIARLRELAR
jgi:hypothetical protein